ncbi:MAG: hypothetical protein U0838_13025 [Chloroflexota bacterium]
MTQGDITKTVRYGVESTRGTGVTCTNILDIAEADWDITPPTIRSDNLTGGVDPSPQVTAGIVVPRIRVKLGSINWDKWQRWLAAAFDGSITAAGAGADKTWGSNAIKPPAVSTGGALTDNLKSYTLEFGYANPSASQPAHKVTGALVERIKLTVPRVGFAQAEIDFVSISAVTDLTAYSGTLSPDAMSAAVPSNSDATGTTGLKVYSDAAGGTIGSTQDAAAVSAEIEWKSFLVADDNAKKLTIGQQAQWTAKYSRFWDAADALGYSRTKAERKVRMDLVGPALGSGTWILGFDLYAAVDAVPKASLNGFASEDVALVPLRDATAATSIAARLVNSVNTL